MYDTVYVSGDDKEEEAQMKIAMTSTSGRKPT